MDLIESKYAVSYKREMQKVFSESDFNILWSNAEKIFIKLIGREPDLQKHFHGILISVFFRQ